MTDPEHLRIGIVGPALLSEVSALGQGHSVGHHLDGDCRSQVENFDGGGIKRLVADLPRLIADALDH